MIESPLFQELLAENTQRTMQRHILRVLEKRFGPVPAEVSAAVHSTGDESKLDTLHDLAVFCPDLETFRAHLHL
jgi:hypothetical protein